MNVKGVFLHVMADALGSVVVLISAAVIWLTDWEYKVDIDSVDTVDGEDSVDSVDCVDSEDREDIVDSVGVGSVGNVESVDIVCIVDSLDSVVSVYNIDIVDCVDCVDSLQTVQCRCVDTPRYVDPGLPGPHAVSADRGADLRQHLAPLQGVHPHPPQLHPLASRHHAAQGRAGVLCTRHQVNRKQRSLKASCNAQA